ncbi:MAG TPA: lipopolysaccharide biosynthesis protein [Polyangiaceae bacterium]|nr:lipopolysaccharide biosynthesis protein [Polyangiaceae bacterium]
MATVQAGSSAPSLRRRLIGGGAWAIFGKGAALALNFLTMAMVTRMLDVGSVGIYQLGQTVVLATAMVARLGLDNTVVYLVSSAVAEGSPARAWRAVRTVSILGACGALAAWALLSLGGVDLLGHLLARGSFARLPQIAAAMGVWTAAVAIQLLTSEALRGFHAIRDAVIYGGVVAGVLTVVALAFVGHDGHLSLSAAAWTTALSTSVAAVVAAAALFLRARRAGPLGPESGHGYAGVLRRSLPVLVSNAMTFVLTNVDVWVVGGFSSGRELALYATPAKLVTLIGVSFLIANQVLPPLIGELAAKKDNVLMERTLRGTAFVVGLPSMAVVLVFVLAGGPLLRVVFGPAYAGGATVLALLCIGQAANILTGSSLFALLMTGHGVAAMWISGTMGLLAGAACLVAVHFWGPTGVAAAVSAVVVLQQLVTLLVARRLVGVWTHVSASAALGEVRRMLAERAAR